MIRIIYEETTYLELITMTKEWSLRKTLFNSSSMPLSFMFSLRFAVSGEQLLVVTQLVYPVKSLANPLITLVFSLASALSFCCSDIFICLSNEFLRRQEMAVKDSYQTAGVNYQIKGLMREDNERIRTYLNDIGITIYILRVVNISLILINPYLLCQFRFTQ
jgi:hypothetical protein